MATSDLLLRHKPYLTPLFDSAAATRSEGLFERSSARNGEPLVLRHDGSTSRPLSSRYDPGREAESLLPDFERWSGREVLVLFGAGNLLFFSKMSGRMRPNQIVLVVEESFELGCFLCHHSPELFEWLHRPGCHLFSGESMLLALYRFLESLPAESLAGVRFVRQRGSVQSALPFYNSIESTMRSMIQSRLSDLLTRFEFSQLWLGNIFHNLLYLPPSGDSTQAGVATLRPFNGALNGRPALLVSAGPSLRASLPLLRRLEGRLFILVCDTAFKVLRRAGIRANAVITLDAQSHSLAHFLGESLDEGEILIADIVAQPRLIRYLEQNSSSGRESDSAGRFLFSATARQMPQIDGSMRREVTPGMELAESVAGEMGDVASGGSVATSAFALLHYLGAGQIALIGQDLAYTGREIHSSGTHHNESWLTRLDRTTTLESINELVVRKRNTFAAVAIGGGEVLGDYVLDLYRRWFVDSIAESETPIFNLTHAGAHIEGTIELRGDSLEKWIAALPEAKALQHQLSEIFAPLQPVQRHLHGELLDLAVRVESIAAAGSDGSAAALLELSVDFPSLAALLRPVDIYLSRNREKFSEERATQLRDKALYERLLRLCRQLRYVRQEMQQMERLKQKRSDNTSEPTQSAADQIGGSRQHLP